MRSKKSRNVSRRKVSSNNRGKARRSKSSWKRKRNYRAAEPLVEPRGFSALRGELNREGFYILENYGEEDGMVYAGGDDLFDIGLNDVEGKFVYNVYRKRKDLTWKEDYSRRLGSNRGEIGINRKWLDQQMDLPHPFMIFSRNYKMGYFNIGNFKKNINEDKTDSITFLIECVGRDIETITVFWTSYFKENVKVVQEEEQEQELKTPLIYMQLE